MKITKSQQKQLEKIVQKHGLDFLVLFGSQINGKTHKESDLDVAVAGQRLGYKESGAVFSDLSDVFRNYNVDVVELQTTTEPIVLYEIFSRGIFLSGSKDEFDRCRIFAYNNYIDSQSLLDLRAQILRRRQLQLNRMYA